MKIVDQYYTFKMPVQASNSWQLQCRLRIFQSHTNVHTVMITDTGFEIGWFLPSVLEKLVDHIVKEFRLDPAQLIWLEHYTSGYRELSTADFSQVAFEWQNGKATNPQWLDIANEVAQALIGEDMQLRLALIKRYA